MRVFLASSSEYQDFVQFMVRYMKEHYHGVLEPVPWTKGWKPGKFGLQDLLESVEGTDASILFWTPDDPSVYRGTERVEPRDNLIFEAGMFVAAHGTDRTQIVVPRDPGKAPGTEVSIPSNLQGLVLEEFPWSKGDSIQSSSLPYAARNVCERLRALGPRRRRPSLLQHLEKSDRVEAVETYVGEWLNLNVDGIVRLAGRPEAREIDVLAIYGTGDLYKALDGFRMRTDARLRACFTNVWDEALVNVYLRQFAGLRPEEMRTGLASTTIPNLLGRCDVDAADPA